MFLDLISYVANALLGIMSTDLKFFEENIPTVNTLYSVIVAVGWGLLIGNCIFQAMKSMMSGLGFEGESPPVLLCRTGIYGFLLIFSKQLCELCLGIGKNVITLIGIPEKVDLKLPDESAFTGVGSSWVLVIIIGIILGFQLIKLFLEIGERYAVVAILTLMCPVGLAMGGSKTTKDICSGYLRTFASMVLMMVTNVLFLKLILSGLATMPTGVMVLPWCVLLVGLTRVARKVDSIISKIGLSPAITGDPLGHGGGKMVALMAARTIISSASKGGKAGVGKGTSSGAGGNRTGGTKVNNAGVSSEFGGQSTSMGGNSSASSSTNSTGTATNSQTSQHANNGQNTRFGGANYAGSQNAANAQNAQSSSQSSHSGGSSFADRTQVAGGTASSDQSSNVRFASGTTSVNTNRFGSASGGSTVNRGGANVVGMVVNNKDGSAGKPSAPSAGKTAAGNSIGTKASAAGGAKVGLPSKPGPMKTGQTPFKTAQKAGQFSGAVQAGQKPKSATAGVKTQPGKPASTFGKSPVASPSGIKITPKGPAQAKPVPPKGLSVSPKNAAADAPVREENPAAGVEPPKQDGDPDA